MFGGERKGKEEKKRKGKKGKEEVIFPGFDIVYGKRAEEGKRTEKLYLLFKIYGDLAVDFRRKQEANFIYAARASRRYKNMGVLSKLQQVGVSLLLWLFLV